MKRKLNLEVVVDVVKEKKNGNRTTIPARYDVEGMMNTIKRAMTTKNQQDMLDEYAKFYILKEIGVKVYPLEN